MEMLEKDGVLLQTDIVNASGIEDSEIVIESVLKFNSNFTFSNCKIQIQGDKSAQIEVGSCELVFEDCIVYFEGNASKPAIFNKNGNLSFDTCSFVKESVDNKETYIQSEADKKNIEMYNCKISDFTGSFLKLHGTNVSLDKVVVDGFNGNFITMQKIDYHRQASLIVNNSSFKNCNTRILTTLIYVACGDTVKFDNTKFEKCDGECIKLADGELRAKAVITNCVFDTCNHKKDSIFSNENKVIYTFRYITEIRNCTFKKVSCISISAQIVKAEIIGCKFLDCKKDEIGGFLDIHVDVDEPIILIKDCSFDRCINEDTYNSGIIYLGSGYVEKCNKETVLIKNCTFNDCKAKQNIRGVEKQEGFFGRSIKLYKLI